MEYPCRRNLSAAALQKLALEKALAFDVDEFPSWHTSPPPLRGVSAALRCTPKGEEETGGSKGKGGGQGGGYPERREGTASRSLAHARDSVP